MRRMIYPFIVLYSRHDKAALVMAAAALGLLVVSTAITLSVNVPIDGQIARAQPMAELPPIPDPRPIGRQGPYRPPLTLVGAGCLFASALWTHHGQRDMQRAAFRAA